MIIAIVADDMNQRQVVLDVFAEYHMNGDVRMVVNDKSHIDLPLGRDVILAEARQRVLMAQRRYPDAKLAGSLAAGLVMLPGGAFLSCAAILRGTGGHEAIGWSSPRPIPETLVQEITAGGDFTTLVREYRQHWQYVDTFSLPDIDELLSHHRSFTEALGEAVSAMTHT